MAGITPYTIQVPQATLDQLQQKLALTHFPDELKEAEWDYGSPLADIKRLIEYWRETYDWRKHEEDLNKLPHFKTKIGVDGFEDLDIHFLHQPSSRKNAIPLLFCHGWPGSFHEVAKVLSPLTKPDDSSSPAFHVVAPSLPNFGFSQSVQQKGFRVPQYAETCHKLMLRLGYSDYVTQGGDWGFWITRTISRLYPSHCHASHLNMIVADPPSPTTASSPWRYLAHLLTPYTASERVGIARTANFHSDGFGYNRIQSTRPQTLGYALADSPSGLLAWIYEKLHGWTDNYPFTPDEILTWVSIYQFSTAGPAASLRIYYEMTADEDRGFRTRELAMRWVPGVKLGLAYFPADIYCVPSRWGKTLGNVVWEKKYQAGGHFAAWEKPEELVSGIREMFARGGGAEKCVPGKNGYD